MEFKVIVAKSLAIVIGGVPFAAVAATGSSFMEPSEVRAQMLGERSPVVRLQRDQEPLELPSFRAILGDREVDKMNEARSRLSTLGDDVDQGAELQKLNIKPSVDLRGRDTPVKQQVGPLCTAWALTGVIENALGVDAKTGKPLDLSESIFGNTTAFIAQPRPSTMRREEKLPRKSIGQTVIDLRAI